MLFRFGRKKNTKKEETGHISEVINESEVDFSLNSTHLDIRVGYEDISYNLKTKNEKDGGYIVADGLEASTSMYLIEKDSSLYTNKPVKVDNKKAYDKKMIAFYMGNNFKKEENRPDLESIIINLSNNTETLEKLVLTIQIDRPNTTKQSIYRIENIYIRIIDYKENKELALYNIKYTKSKSKGLIIGEIYKKDEEWVFTSKHKELKNLTTDYINKQILCRS